MAQQQHFRSLWNCRVQVIQGAAIGKGRYELCPHRAAQSDEVMEREKLTEEVEQFEY